MNDIRLDKYISQVLGLTRTESKSLIKNKKIKINDAVVRDSDYKVQEDDIVTYNDNILKYEEKVYLMMNKPKDYVCSTEDKHNKIVLDLISGYNKKNLMIVGRLDIDTTGLLLITSDGDFVHKLTSPNKKITKKYYVECEKEFTKEDVKIFLDGVTIYLEKDGEYKCKSAMLEILDEHNKAYISIAEGKFHQVKKMCASVGKKVLELKRVQIGNLVLDENLKEGEYRPLTNEELEMLS